MASNDKNDLNQPEEVGAEPEGVQPKPVSKPPRSVAARPVPRRKPEIDEEPYEGSPLSMMGIRSNLLHRSGTKVVLALLIFIFAIASVLFSASMGGGGGTQGGMGGNGPDPVASVAGQNIGRDRFNQNLSRQLQFAQMYGQKAGPVELMGLRQQTLQSLVEEGAQYETATQAGITASGADIDKEIDRLIEEQIKSEKGQDEAAFRRQIEAKYPGGEADYRAEMRKNYDRDAVGRSLVLKKYEESVKEANKVTEDDYKRSVTRLKLRQIVVRPKLPAPTEKDVKAAQEKNGVAAKERADKLAAQLKGKTGPALTAAFIALAQKESDDTATKAKGGDIGAKLPSELTVGPVLKDALQNSKESLVGPLQDDITKDYSIFLIESRKLELPKDYAKNKAKLLKDYETQRDNEAWARKQEEIKKVAVPELYDPALVAYKIQSEQVYAAPAAEQAGLRQQALAKYEEALGHAVPLEAAAIRYQMAQLYRETNQPAKVVETLQAALKDNENAPQMRLELARALREQKKPKEALEQLKALSKNLTDNPSAPSMFGGGNPDDQIRYQLASEYEQLGDKKAADAERKKIVPAAPQGMGGMMGGAGSPITINPGQ